LNIATMTNTMTKSTNIMCSKGKKERGGGGRITTIEGKEMDDGNGV
jgi:hypothetical protein